MQYSKKGQSPIAQARAFFIFRFTDKPTPSFPETPKNNVGFFWGGGWRGGPKPQTAAYSTYFGRRLLNATFNGLLTSSQYVNNIEFGYLILKVLLN